MSGIQENFPKLSGKIVHLEEVAQLAEDTAQEQGGPVLGSLRRVFWDFAGHVAQVYLKAGNGIQTWYNYPDMPKGNVAYFGDERNLIEEKQRDTCRMSYVSAEDLCAAIEKSSMPKFEKRALVAAAERAFDHSRRTQTGQMYNRENPPSFTPQQIMDAQLS